MKLLNKFGTITTLLVVILISACETDESPCPGINVDVDIDSATMTAHVVATGLDDLDFELYVNDQLVESFTAGELDSTEFSFTFEPGEYKVCVRAESASCDQRIEGCVEFTIGDPSGEENCLGLSFEKEQIDDFTYEFYADFDSIETTAYDWYADGELVDSEPLTDNRDNMLRMVFEAGTHTVCIVAETDSCGEVEYCKEIVIEDGEVECVEEVAFEAEMVNDYKYYFYADFEEKEDIKYKWYVNDEFVDIENSDDTETDHKLIWEFEPGTHTVCLVADQDGCESVEYCEEFVIEQQCAEEVFFEWEQENDFTYYFYADFEGKYNTRYKWLIDGEEVDIENSDDSDTDHKLIWQFEEGTYSVCLITDQDGCETVEYCEEIVVEEQNCVEMSYTSELNQETNTYTFTADFEGRDDVTYIWKVYVNDDLQGSETRQAGSDEDHQFEWQFESGVEYEICLFQDGCLDQQVCNVFSVD